MAPAPDLSRELQDARQQTDQLFDLIRPDSLYERPIPERHRLVFYLGHLEAFDWNLIAQWAMSAPRFHAEFDRLFAFGIDPDESGLPTDKPADWPSRQEVDRYNACVRETLDRLIPQAPAQLVHVAIEHRLMHAETFAYLLHGLDYEHKTRKPQALPPASARDREDALPAWITVPAGAATLGRPANDGFGWDNEFREYSVEVPEFTIGKYKVTNREYLDFVRQGGSAPALSGWIEAATGFIAGCSAKRRSRPDAPAYVTL